MTCCGRGLDDVDRLSRDAPLHAPVGGAPPAIGSSRVPRRRASSTSAPITLLASSSSGCQSTPSAKRLSGSSIASITSSPSARPVDRRAPRRAPRRPGGGASAPRSSPRPTTRAASEPGSSATVWSANVPGVWRWSSWPTRSGRCCSSVPPQITFSICMPRQIPSSGMSRSSARVPSASSKRSRSSQVPVVSGCGARAVGARVDVGAAGEHQPVEQVEQLVGALERPVVGRQQQRQAAGALHRQRVVARRDVAGRLPRPPAHRLDRAADADDRSSRAHSRSKPR